ncbi:MULTISPECIES: MIP/aquaporin family protein [Bacillaceae]|uniref:MIP/aquaporin family protein n=1 Tax=Bacillaceae TaxID=186817 RepID=UPI00194FED03|nr:MULTISPECIES: aquaporin [Bacillaceae]MCG7315461.1 aquaporin [Priestia flexa]WHX79810.1 aquaporin [Priestia flexa]
MEKKVYPINYFDSHPQNLVYVKELKKKILAEFIGTFSLVFAGTGAIVVNSTTKSLTHVGIAITFGLIVLALIYSFGYVSGAHFNPAVTLAFWYLKRIKLNEALLYILIQFSSATCASIILRLLFGNVAKLGSTVPVYSWPQSFILEVLLTFILLIVILNSSTEDNQTKSFAGIAIGSTVCLEAMFGGPISGASMNPARSFGPAVISTHIEYLWVYLLATTLGALLAARAYKYLNT